MAAVYKIIVSVLFVILGLFGGILSSPVPQGYGSSHFGPSRSGGNHFGPSPNTHLGPSPNSHLGPNYGAGRPVISNY